MNRLRLIIIAVVGILIATSAYTIAPLQLKTLTESFVFGFLEVPYHQAVQNKPFTVKLDTGNNNQLKNGSFDSMTALNGWDEVATGTWAKTDTGCLEGSCLEITTSTIGDAGTLQQSITQASEMQYSGVVYAYRGATDDGEYEICVNEECRTIGHETGTWHPYQLFFYGANPIVRVRPSASFNSGDTVDIKVDKASFGLGLDTYKVANIGDWEDANCTSNWTTNTTTTCKVKRIGDEARIQFNASLSGAPNATTLVFNLPSDMDVDEDKLVSDDDYGNGSWEGIIRTSGGALYPTKGTYLINDNQVLMTYYRDTASGETPSRNVGLTHNGPIAFGNGDQVTVTATVPIQGWSSVTSTVVTQTQEETVESANSFVAFIADDGTVSRESLDWINGNCSVTDTSLYTCNLNVTTNAALSCQGTPEVQENRRIATVSQTSNQIVFRVRQSDTPSTASASNFNIHCTKTGSDYNKTNVITGSFDAIKSSESCQVEAKDHSNDSITQNTEDIPFKTVIKDNCNAWSNAGNTGSNTNDAFTAPRKMRVHVSGSVRGNGSLVGGNNVNVFVNGSWVKLIGRGIDDIVPVFSGVVDLNEGDVLTVRTNQSPTLGNAGGDALQYHHIEITELPDTQSIVENMNQDRNVKCQTKTLSADVTSSGTLSELSFTTEIGKKYRLFGQCYTLDFANSGSHVNLYFEQDSDVKAHCYNKTESGTYQSIVASIVSPVFTANGTSLDAEVTADADSVLKGNGTGVETWIELCELPKNYIETSEF